MLMDILTLLPPFLLYFVILVCQHQLFRYSPFKKQLFVLLLFSGFRFSVVALGDPSAGPLFRLSELCDHDHREALRDPLQHLRHHRVHVRDRERDHRHLRFLPRIQETHSSLAGHG